MQPWTDTTSDQPAIAVLLADVVPPSQRTLILGPHSQRLIESVLARSSDVTILVRSVADAQRLGEDFGSNLQVVAGALDGLQVEPFEVIVAADGLDRVLGYDSDSLNWTARLSALSKLATPDAVVVLGLENEFSLLNLLDRRPSHERHGNDEWIPLRDDPTRPGSVNRLKAALPWPTEVYADFSSRTLIATDVAAASGLGELPTRLAVEALESTAVPLLTSPGEGVESAARAGLLASIATGWLAVCNTSAPHKVYAQTGPAVLTADPAAAGWQTRITAEASLVDDLVFDPAVVPATVPDGVSVESVLFRLAAAEDVPAFRKLAAELGEWASESRVILRWDDVIVQGETFTHGVSAWATAVPVAKEDQLATAWYRFHERLVGQHRRHPWPPWMVGDDLVATWLSMSGVEPPEQLPATTPDSPSASVEHVARGKQLAGALAGVLEAREYAEADVRTALADAERAQHELFELKGHVYGLERTLGFRNKAMKTRENRIRELRTQLQKLTAAHERIRGSRTYALSRVFFHTAQIRKPQVVVRKVSRLLRRR